MTVARTVAAAALLLALIAAINPTTNAYTLSGYKWGTMDVPFYVNAANKDVSPNAAISALQAGMAAWSTQSGTPFRFFYAGQVSSSTVGLDKKNVVMFRPDDKGGTIATSYWWYSNGYIIDSDIVFWDGGWAFFTGQSGCNSGAYIEDIAAHELGHTLGLRHSSVNEATMYGSYTRCSQALRTLSSDDIAGAKKLYGSNGTGGGTGTNNTAPIVTITNPANGVTVTAGTTVAFSGSASDTEDGNITSNLAWTSSISGQIGTGGSFTKALTAGTHTITAKVTDSGGSTGQKSITVLATTAPSPNAATLTATARTSSTGAFSARLVWSGLVSTKVDVYRNGTRVATKDNDGSASDPVPNKGTYTYKLCASGTSTCTNQATVTF